MYQIGRGQALGDAPHEQVHDGFLFALRECAVQDVRCDIVRQVQRVQHQACGFIHGVVRAVAEVEGGFIEAARAPADEVARGVQFFDSFLRGTHGRNGNGLSMKPRAS